MSAANAHINNKTAMVHTQALFAITCIFWLFTKVISWKAWIADRTFPVVPPFDFLLYVPGWVHWLLLISGICLLLILIFRPGNKTLQIALLIVETSSCILDQNRWHPWEYQYLLLVFIYIINANKKQQIISTIAFLLIGIYFYSALSKFNQGYLYSTWERTILNNFLKIPYAVIRQNQVLIYSGYILSLIELLAAVGLLFRKTRKLSAIILIATHIFILLLLGPLGINYNSVVWPWNILMIFFLYFIFIKENEIRFAYTLHGANKIIILCAGILPLLHYAGLWDNYLSFNLYSGNNAYMSICIENIESSKEVKPYTTENNSFTICPGKTMLHINNWAMQEMNIPPCSEIRVYYNIKKQWLLKHPNTGDKFILYYYGPTGAKDIQEMK